MSRAASLLYRLSLVVIPICVAYATPIVARAWFYSRSSATGWPAALREAAAEPVQAHLEAGFAALLLNVLANVTAFGALIVTCVAASYYWNAKRVYCILICGILTSLAFWMYHWHGFYSERYDLGSAALMRHVAESWLSHIFHHDPRALLGIALGAAIALLPIFKPGRRYYLRRGLCPKCAYDLRYQFAAGCPECGWRRGA